MTHQRWKISPPDPWTRFEMVLEVQGYILALEDVIKDLDTFEVDTWDAGDGRYTVERIRDKVYLSLEQANLTLRTLEENHDPNDQDGPGNPPDHDRGQDPSSLPQ